MTRIIYGNVSSVDNVNIFLRLDMIHLFSDIPSLFNTVYYYLFSINPVPCYVIQTCVDNITCWSLTPCFCRHRAQQQQRRERWQRPRAVIDLLSVQSCSIWDILVRTYVSLAQFWNYIYCILFCLLYQTLYSFVTWCYKRQFTSLIQ